MELKEFLYVGEYVKDRLYFATARNGNTPTSNGKHHYFCIDDILVYENFYFDFGPLNLSMLYRYCTMLSKSLNTFSDRIIIHYTTMNEKKRSNAAFLIASFAIIYLNKNVEEAYAPLCGKHIPAFLPFRDATTTEPTITLSIKDCLQAIYRAQALGFFRFDDFNLAEYENYERVEEGDMNWIVPQKFLAFSGPHSHVDKANSQEHAPEYYFSYFKQNGVTNIIRLNKKSYDANRFVDSGFQHNDLYFHDGSTPSNLILDKFFKITENAPGVVAVHCKAGLGRTGSVIACYLMKHYRFNVGEAIAWVRICRPGSIIGIQQKWLRDKKTQLWIEGNRYRKKKYGSSNFIPTHKYGIYSNEIHLACNAEEPQTEFLYEPTVLKKTDLSDIMHNISAINLEDKDKDEAFKARVSIHDQTYEKKKVELMSSAIRNSRSRTNASQGDKLYQIKASRKQPRSLSTPMTPAGIKPRVSHAKSKHIPSSNIYNIALPLEIPKPAFCIPTNFYSDFPSEHTNGYQHGRSYCSKRLAN